jgi:S-adenosylmethionine-diacylglycerol 3-amino-3-carboxypropyl transferase
MPAEISAKARFDLIRYAQLWEDADVLLLGLGAAPGATLVSICSAGDNALAMLTLDPARIVVVDLSAAQIACLRARIAAFRTLDHAAFLELIGSRPSARRSGLLNRVIAALEPEQRPFWEDLRDSVVRYGMGGVGKFERYFRIFRRVLLPLVHGRRTIDEVFAPKSEGDRLRFLDERWNSWRWRLLLKVFFSRTVMGRLGRDPAFFDHVGASVSDHVACRVRHAVVDLDPSQNPYLHWILKGDHNAALPFAWRAENYATIRDRLDRLDIRQCALESLVTDGIRADGFNLSDIFEYMDVASFARLYGDLLAAANPGARLVYWNMLAPRRMPEAHAHWVRRRQDIEAQGRAMDKAFFYSDFVVEEVMVP